MIINIIYLKLIVYNYLKNLFFLLIIKLKYYLTIFNYFLIKKYKVFPNIYNNFIRFLFKYNIYFIT